MSGGSVFIGLDLGTSALKSVAFREDQTVAATATAPLGVSRPRFGWSAQNPADRIKAAERLLDELATQMPIAEVRGIGLSGQMHGATALGADDRMRLRCANKISILLRRFRDVRPSSLLAMSRAISRAPS